MAKTFSAQNEYGAFPYQLPTKSFTLSQVGMVSAAIMGHRRVWSACSHCSTIAFTSLWNPYIQSICPYQAGVAG